MANPIIDNITWDPDNRTKSIRDLQQALNDLQTDWDSKLPKVYQITSSDNLSSSDWESLIEENTREDDTLLHFDAESQEFLGAWRKIFGNYQSRSSRIQPGRTEVIRLDPLLDAAGTLTYIYDFEISLPRKAKLAAFIGIMYTDPTAETKYEIRVDTNPSTTFVRTEPLFELNVFKQFMFMFIPFTYQFAAGSYNLRLRINVTGDGVISTTAPLPNVISSSTEGHLDPQNAYLEVIYE